MNITVRYTIRNPANLVEVQVYSTEKKFVLTSYLDYAILIYKPLISEYHIIKLPSCELVKIFYFEQIHRFRYCSLIKSFKHLTIVVFHDGPFHSLIFILNLKDLKF